MKVAKEFRWEGAHRLPWHVGLCRHLHGHSYRMHVELSGPPDEQGMVADFQEIKAWVRPLVSEWDHAILVAESDRELLSVVREHDWRHVVLPYDTTAENLCRFVATWLLEHTGDRLSEIGVTLIRVRIMETGSSYAEFDLVVGAGE
jgi:6-pyruvoyltetrahydropterin/6-carboxytetrahydropterin synthase